MTNKKPWSTPQLKLYGSVEQLTENVNITKTSGSQDTINLTIITPSGSITTTTTIPGTSVTSVTKN